MKIFTKLAVLSLFVGSLVGVSSCKDYDEDNYTNAQIAAKTIDEALKEQIKTLNTTITELKKRDQALADSIKNCMKNCSDNWEQYAIDKIKIEGDIKTLQNRLDTCCNGLETTVASLVKNSILIKERMDIIGDSVNTVYSKLGTVATNLENLSKQVKTNKDSIVILNAKFNDYVTYEALGTTLSNYYTKSDLYTKSEVDQKLQDYVTKSNLTETLKDYATLDSLGKALDACHAKCQEYTDAQIKIISEKLDSVNNALNTKIDAKVDTADFVKFQKQVVVADLIMALAIDSLSEVTAGLQTQVDSAVARIAKLEDARAKQVTGIVVQQVSNRAFGTYNGILTNLQTNMLAVLYGTANSAVDFPSNGDTGVEHIYAVSGGTLMKTGNGNAGQILVTINPNTVDFEGLRALTLVNSKDDTCSVYLSNVARADNEIKLGYSRAAANNGLYSVDATLDPKDIDNKDIHLNIDKKAIRSSLGELVRAKNASGAKLALKDVVSATINTAVTLQPTAYGVKCGWEDAYGEHAVYSNYNIAALAYQPLGFNSLDGVFDKESNGAYWRVYDKAKNLVSTVATKAGKSASNAISSKFNLDNIKATLGDLQTKLQNIKFDTLKASSDSIIVTTKVEVPKQNIDLDLEVEIPKTTVPGQTIYFEVPDKYNSETGTFDTKKDSIVVKDTEVELGKVEVKKTITLELNPFDVKIDITKDVNKIFSSMTGGINESFKNVNELVASLDGAMADINNMLDAINNLQTSLEEATYLTSVFNYLDKAAQKVANVTPKMLKPALLVNSENGFGFAGFAGAPSQVKGRTTLYPTTYTMELLAPIYKKYIRVNDNAGKILDDNDKDIDITDQLKPGKNTIEYRALDYQGTEWVGYYEIEK